MKFHFFSLLVLILLIASVRAGGLLRTKHPGNYEPLPSEMRLTDNHDLITATKEGNFHEVERILRANDNPNIRDTATGYTPIEIAAEKGNYVIVQLLLSDRTANKRDNWEQQLTRSLILAANEGHSAIVEILLSAGAPANSFVTRFNNPLAGATPLCIALQNGKLETVKVLLADKGVNVNAKTQNGNTALIRASEGGFSELVMPLLEAGAIPDAKNWLGQTALHYASGGGYVDIVKTLLDAGAKDFNQDRNGNTALHLAVDNQHVEVMQLLVKDLNELEASTELNAQNKFGTTALLLASWKGNLSMVEALLNAGAKTDLQDKDGKTALHYAASNGNVEIVQLLLNARAEKSLRDYNGNTALLLAASRGHAAVVQMLLAAGDNANAENFNRDTALHFAASLANAEMISELCKANANVNAENKNGDTPLHMLPYNENQSELSKTLAVLLNYGADLTLENYNRKAPEITRIWKTFR